MESPAAGVAVQATKGRPVVTVPVGAVTVRLGGASAVTVKFVAKGPVSVATLSRKAIDQTYAFPLGMAVAGKGTAWEAVGKREVAFQYTVDWELVPFQY